jgi:hypothetical protein
MINQNIVKIGITGHLSLNNPDIIGASIYQILKSIANKYLNKQLIFYSPASPGADLLSAKIAVELSIPLFIILPFNQDEYLQTFSVEDKKLFLQLFNKAEGVIKLSEAKQNNVYEMLGEYLVKNMDVLIAIWNGQEARGPGGTGDVVQGFRQSRKPLAWIRADNMLSDQPVNLHDSLPLGTIQYENW